jgi:hypothetical protein
MGFVAISLSFPFSKWVSSAECYWSLLPRAPKRRAISAHKPTLQFHKLVSAGRDPGRATAVIRRR